MPFGSLSVNEHDLKQSHGVTLKVLAPNIAKVIFTIKVDRLCLSAYIGPKDARRIAELILSSLNEQHE